MTNASVTRVADATASYPEKCSHPPQPAVPIGIFACVTNHGSTYDVTFGYENDNGVDVSVPVSSANFVEPAPINRGQPELFAPGKVTGALHGARGGERGNDRMGDVPPGNDGARRHAVLSVKCGNLWEEIGGGAGAALHRANGSTYTAIFGYLNQNAGAVVVPVGASNGVGACILLDHRPASVFRAGWRVQRVRRRNAPVGRAISWIVKSAGETKRATASGQPGPHVQRGSADDLAVVKSATPTSVLVGDRVTYTIVVRNRGALTAQAATVVDRPDGRVTLVSAETSRGSCRLTGRQVVCALGALGPIATATIVVTATAAQSGTSRNRATVTSNPADVPADDTDTATVEIQPRPATPPSGGAACGSRKC